jgi:hypothetical protein
MGSELKFAEHNNGLVADIGQPVQPLAGLRPRRLRLKQQVKEAANHTGGYANPFVSSRPSPKVLTECTLHIKGRLVLKHVITRTR